MKSFIQWLIESTMDLSTALSVFGLAQPPKNAEELKSLYKKLAMKNHPDHGGSTQKMQELNAAKDFLGKYVGVTSVGGSASGARTTNPETARKNAEAQERVKKMKAYQKLIVASVEKFFKKFNKKAYKDYFESIFKKTFTVDVKTGTRNSMFMYDTVIPYLEMTAYSEGHLDVFNLKLDADVWNSAWEMVNGNSLSANNVVFDYFIGTDALTGGKKQVIVKKLVLKKSDPSILTNPELVFPKARMTKLASGQVRKGSKLQKRDFDAMIKNKWAGEVVSDNTWVIPFEKTKDGIERCFGIARYTLQRKGFYQVTSNFCERDTSKRYPSWNHIKGDVKISCSFIPENQYAMDFFEKLVAYAKANASNRKKIAEFIKKGSEEVASKE